MLERAWERVWKSLGPRPETTLLLENRVKDSARLPAHHSKVSSPSQQGLQT